MATETVTLEGIAISEPRLTLAQESAWELDALRNTVNDLCSDLGHPDLTQCHLMALRLKIRGLTMRMGELASVIMSVLDNDDTTANLHRKVTGEALAQEVANG
jgi:hypothetical protein